jgi:DNA-binding MarR family transcriptional regulator
MPESISSIPAQDVTQLIGFQLLTLSNRIGLKAEKQSREQAGLSLPEYRVLTLVCSQGEVSVSSVCALLTIDKAWVSRTLTKLMSKALVSVTNDLNDARRTVYSPTPAGLDKCQRLIALARQRQTELLEGFSANEKTQLASMIERMRQNV